MIMLHLPHWVRTSDRPGRIVVGVGDELKMKLRELAELGFSLEAYDDRDGGLQFCVSHENSGSVFSALVPKVGRNAYIGDILASLNVKLMVDRVVERDVCQASPSPSDSIATSGGSAQ